MLLPRARGALVVIPDYQESLNVDALLRRVGRAAPTSTSSSSRRGNVDRARRRVLDYSTRTSAGMLNVFPKRATMIVTPGELDVTKA